MSRSRTNTFASDFFNNSIKTIQDPSLVITDFLEKKIIQNDKLLANKSLEALTNFILEDTTTEFTKDEFFSIILIQRDLANWKVIASLCQKINKNNEDDLLFLVYLAEALIKLKKTTRAKDLLDFVISNEKVLKEDEREENHFSAIMTDNSSEEIHFAIGKAYFISGKPDQAMFHFEISAKKGFSRAYHMIGMCKFHGLGCEKNEEEAVKYFVQASHYGDLTSYISVAHALLSGTGIAINEIAAFEWYEAGSKFAHPRCQFNLALCYEKGIGTDIDHEKANENYRLSSIQGDFMSQYNLGLKLIEGRNIEKNENEGFKWIQKSALAGHKTSQYQLGMCFAKGIGTKKNEKKSFKWFKFSADNGFIPSFKTVGFFYQHGYGVKSDQKEASKWFLRSSNEAKDPDSMIEIARCYQHGIGIEKDVKVASEWYETAKKLVRYELPPLDKL
eukprot:gene7695-12161_t